ncbi:hypothetical protein GC170_21350 [bacterium]|nr:hypothetical protein [bacterium]
MQDSPRPQVLVDPYERACRAYFDRAKLAGYAHVDQPSESMSGEETIEGKTYFVLRNSRGPLDIFEIGTDGRLWHKPDFDLDSLEASG